MSSGAMLVSVVAIIMSSLAGLVGYSLAGRNEEKRDERAAKREKISRQAALRERLEERRHDFQLDVLLELQDALRLYTRAISLILTRDSKTISEHGQMFQVGDELNQDSFDANINLNRLIQRVLDDQLRQKLEDYQSFAGGIDITVMHALKAKSMTAEDAVAFLEDGWNQLAVRHQEVGLLIGEQLRKELGRTIQSVGLDEE